MPPGGKGPTRAQRLADRVLALSTADLALELAQVLATLAGRHRDVEGVLLRRFHEVNGPLIHAHPVGDDQAKLIGAYFCEEYSFEAAALFNPSIVAHPDQSGVAPGALRFVLSLRGVGEGHVSAITFRTGVFEGNGTVAMDAASAQAITPRIEAIADGTPDDPDTGCSAKRGAACPKS